MNDPTDETGNVVSLAECRSIRWVEPVRFVHCDHVRISVDEHTRGVTCQGCGKVLDPFDWLLAWARAENREYLAIKALRDEAKALAEHIRELKRERAAEKSKLDDVLIAALKKRGTHENA